MMPKPCPIAEARRIGQSIGADRVLIIAMDETGQYTAATWGKTRAKCKAMGEWLDRHAEKVATHMADRT